MSQTTITAPFRADHVGSLLRPENLLKAREDYKNGNITKKDLRAVETQELRRIVDKHIEVGLELVTDGAFRRSWWPIDFLERLTGLEGYVPERGIPFQAIETAPSDVRNIGKISFNPEHPFLEDFKM